MVRFAVKAGMDLNLRMLRNLYRFVLVLESARKPYAEPRYYAAPALSIQLLPKSMHVQGVVTQDGVLSSVCIMQVNTVLTDD